MYVWIAMKMNSMWGSSRDSLGAGHTVKPEMLNYKIYFHGYLFKKKTLLKLYNIVFISFDF